MLRFYKCTNSNYMLHQDFKIHIKLYHIRLFLTLYHPLKTMSACEPSSQHWVIKCDAPCFIWVVFGGLRRNHSTSFQNKKRKEIVCSKTCMSFLLLSYLINHLVTCDDESWPHLNYYQHIMSYQVISYLSNFSLLMSLSVLQADWSPCICSPPSGHNRHLALHHFSMCQGPFWTARRC